MEKLKGFIVSVLLSGLMIYWPLGYSAQTLNQIANFSIDQANAKLVEVQQSLNSEKLFDSQSYAAIQSVRALQEKAQQCATQGLEEIEKIDAILKHKQLASVIVSSPNDYEYLNHQRNIVAKRTAACEVYDFKVNQLIDAYADYIKKHSRAKAIKIVEPIWAQLSTDVLEQFSVRPERVYQNSGIRELTLPDILSLMGVIIVSLIISGFAHHLCSQFLRHQQDHHVVTNHAAKVTRRYVFVILPLILVAVLLHSFFYTYEALPTIVGMSYAIFMYFLSIAIADFILYLPTKKSKQLLNSDIKHRLFVRYVVLVSVILFGYLGAIFLKEQVMVVGLVNFIRAAYISVLLFTLFWLIWLLFKIPIFIKRAPILVRVLSKLMIAAIFAVLISAEWLGYRDVSLFVLNGTVLSVFALLLFWGFMLLIERVFTVFEDQRYEAAQVIRRLTNLKWHHPFIEFYMLRTACYLIMLGILLITMMLIWGAPLIQVDSVKSAMLDGFTLLGVKIIPLNIVVGLVVFSVINMIGRVYATRVAIHYQAKNSDETQVAISSVIQYLAFFIAVLAGLLIAGVSLTGLAIIAGALSVGIGFGLQNIVNNFLSGLILLIQKPVKPGDRVIVGNTEGFIRKIRVLQTQIKTLSREDVIIPNADLMSHPVVNYMFRDSYWRVTCQVGVQYGSDTELVKKVLLEVAAKHPDVLRDEPNEPVVLFTQFGDSALHFELWCIIQDVNKKYRVLSELNFAIDMAFREHNVVIAFPQRDIHIKEVVKLDANKDAGDQ